MAPEVAHGEQRDDPFIQPHQPHCTVWGGCTVENAPAASADTAAGGERFAILCGSLDGGMVWWDSRTGPPPAHQRRVAFVCLSATKCFPRTSSFEMEVRMAPSLLKKANKNPRAQSVETGASPSPKCSFRMPSFAARRAFEWGQYDSGAVCSAGCTWLGSAVLSYGTRRVRLCGPRTGRH
jgi:hypothetical protein